MREVDILRTLTAKKLNLVAPDAPLVSTSYIRFVQIAAQDLLLVEDTFP